MTSVNVFENCKKVVVGENGIRTIKIVTPGPSGAKGDNGAPGVGIPAGGTTGQLLAKASEDDYDSEWTSNPIVESISFDTSAATDPLSDGQLAWNPDEGTLELGKGGISNYIGQETMVLCRNNSNTVAIPKGTAVRFAGTVGASGRLKVAPMIADGTLPGYVFFGVTDQEIPGGEDGYVSTFGKIRGVNTSAYLDGDILWCSPTTPGGFTKTEPQAPNLKLAVAAVVRAANNGTIFVRATTGSRLADLHDVEANGGKQQDDSLVWNAASQRWEPKALSFMFSQPTPSAVWTVNHNLGFKPAVELFNSGSQEIEGDVVHTSSNQTVISFNLSVAGFARLS